MKQHTISSLFMASMAAVSLVACYTGSTLDMTSATAPSNLRSAGIASTDLPCDVAQVLADRCWSCHGVNPVGSPMPLVHYADLMAISTNTNKSMAEESIVRMKDSARPMPPSGLLDPTEVSVLEAWVTSGSPTGSCAITITDSALPDGPTICTSNSYWTRGNHGSQSMHPGGACNACHSQGGEGPRFAIAGTVYPSRHEPNDCNGTNGSTGATVVITDANGTDHVVGLNAAGNFSIRSGIATPYRAKVVQNGKERAMATPQSNGDCNACHTEQGAEGAPGRVVAPL